MYARRTTHVRTWQTVVSACRTPAELPRRTGCHEWIATVPTRIVVSTRASLDDAPPLVEVSHAEGCMRRFGRRVGFRYCAPAGQRRFAGWSRPERMPGPHSQSGAA